MTASGISTRAAKREHLFLLATPLGELSPGKEKKLQYGCTAQRGMNGCGAESLHRRMPEEKLGAERGVTLSIARAGLSASPKWEYNHGKHQRDIIHRPGVLGCQCVEALGQRCILVAYHRGEGKTLPFCGVILGTPQHRVLRAAGFSHGLAESRDLEEPHTQTCRW